MFASLAGLILYAITLMRRSIDAELPPPLQQMAPSLADARSFRQKSMITQAMGDTLHMTRTETTAVRRGQDFDGHTVNRTIVAGMTKYSEWINNEHGTYHREDQRGAWQWTEREAKVDEPRPGVLESLAADVHWTALDDEVINRQECLSYRAIRGNGAGNWEQVLLWIAKDSLRPVELIFLSLHGGRPIAQANPSQGEPPSLRDLAGGLPLSRQVSSQVVTWSDWDSPVLGIPSIDV
jgi:hypothetical protein